MKNHLHPLRSPWTVLPKTNPSSYFLFLSVLLIASLVSSCATSNSPKPVKIGVIATLTGVGAYQGQQELRGLELARDWLNTHGGIDGRRIELIVEDSKAEPSTAISAAKKLTEVDGVRQIIGDSWSSTTAAIVPETNRQGVILISPVATLDSLAEDDYFFRTMPSTKSMMNELARHAYTTMGSRKAGILRQDTPFGFEHSKDFAEAFERMGGIIVGEERFDLKETDVRGPATKILHKEPDAVLNLHATGPMTGLLIKQAREIGLNNVSWLGTFATHNSKLLEQYPTEIEGIVFPYPYEEKKSWKERRKEGKEGTPSFSALYQERYHESPELISAQSFDTLMLLAMALKGPDGSPDSVKSALLSIRGYDGASGTISFDANGDVEKPMRIKTVRNGRFEFIG